MKPVTILDFERYSNMDKMLRLIAERGYQSSRAVAEKPKRREIGAELAAPSDARGFWYAGKNRAIGKAVKILVNNPMTIDELVDTIGDVKKWSLTRSLEYARRYGFVESLGHGKWVSTGKHLTLKP